MNHVSSGIIRHYVVAFVCLYFYLTGYKSGQFIRRALHCASGRGKFLRQIAQSCGGAYTVIDRQTVSLNHNSSVWLYIYIYIIVIIKSSWSHGIPHSLTLSLSLTHTLSLSLSLSFSLYLSCHPFLSSIASGKLPRQNSVFTELMYVSPCLTANTSVSTCRGSKNQPPSSKSNFLWFLHIYTYIVYQHNVIYCSVRNVYIYIYHICTCIYISFLLVWFYLMDINFLGLFNATSIFVEE